MERYEYGGDVYGNPGVTLDFSVNTNPLGMPEEVRRALIDHVDEYSRYPDPHCRALVCAPTFSEYERALASAGCLTEHYTLTAENNFMLTENIEERLTAAIREHLDINFIYRVLEGGE